MTRKCLHSQYRHTRARSSYVSSVPLSNPLLRLILWSLASLSPWRERLVGVPVPTKEASSTPSAAAAAVKPLGDMTLRAVRMGNRAWGRKGTSALTAAARRCDDYRNACPASRLRDKPPAGV